MCNKQDDFVRCYFFIAQLENEVIIITLKSIASMTLIDSCGLNKKRVNIIAFYPYPCILPSGQS